MESISRASSTDSLREVLHEANYCPGQQQDRYEAGRHADGHKDASELELFRCAHPVRTQIIIAAVSRHRYTEVPEINAAIIDLSEFQR
jgi:hypothetical protein